MNESGNIFKVIETDNTEELGRLITGGIDIMNSRSRTGESPLRFALRKGKRNSATLLSDLRGEFCDLVAAIDANKTPAIKKIAAEKPNLLRMRDENGQFPLHLAVVKNDRKVAEILIDAGAHVDCTDRLGKTPLHRALSLNKLATAELLISHGAALNEKDRHGNTPLHFCKTLKAVRLMLAAGADVDIRNDAALTPLHLMVFRCKNDAIKLLISKGAELNAPGAHNKTPLDFSFGKTFDVLRKRGAEHRNDQESRIYDEIKKGRVDDVRALLEMNPGLINARYGGWYTMNCTPLHSAVEFNSIELAALLISRGANVNARDMYGNSPLSGAYSLPYGNKIEVMMKR